MQYLLATITIHDRETYSLYEAGFMDIFLAHGGTLLSVDETPTLLEGTWSCTRTVLAVFDDEEAALGFYHSDDYQALAQHRFAASEGNVVLIKGLS